MEQNIVEIRDNALATNDRGQDGSAAVRKRTEGVVLFGLVSILILTVVGFGAVDSWAQGLLSLISAVIVTIWFFDAWKNKAISFSDSTLQLPIAGLILIGLIQLLPLRTYQFSGELIPVEAVRSLSSAPFATRMAVVQLTIYLIFFGSGLITINSRPRLNKVVFAIIVFGSLAAFFGILQRLATSDSIYGIRPTLQSIPFASYVNQHHFAALLEMTIALPLAMLFGRAARRDRLLLLGIAVTIMGMAILFTSSRGGLLGLLGVLGFIVAANLMIKPIGKESSNEDRKVQFRFNLALVGGALALLLVVVGLVVLLGGDEALLRGTGLESAGQDVSNGRIHFWSVALRIFRDNPLIGTGLDSFGTVFTRFDSWNGQVRVEQAHNDYLQILADGGVLGLLCAAAFIVLLFKRGLRRIAETARGSFRRSINVGALAGCFGILLHSFFDFPLRTPANAFFFLTLAVLATVSIDHTEFRRRKKPD